MRTDRSNSIIIIIIIIATIAVLFESIKMVFVWRESIYVLSA